MITGAHSIIYSQNAEADRAFLRDVLGLPHVDAGEGWLIFGLPPAEVAVHPSEENDVHEFYLLCEDVEALVARLAALDVPCGPVMDRGWGLITAVTLPGGGTLGIYEPRHVRAASAAAPKRKPAARKKAAPRRKPTARKKAATKRKPAAKKKPAPRRKPAKKAARRKAAPRKKAARRKTRRR